MGKDGISKKPDNTEEMNVNMMGKKKRSTAVLILLMLLYFFTNVFLSFVSRSTVVISFLGEKIPLATFTGVFSSIGNICIIFMTVFYRKRGFIIALLLLSTQFPVLIINLLVQHSPSALPGIFNNMLTAVAIALIYQRNKEIDKFQAIEVEHLKSQQRFSQRLFEQTATALVNAIDAKDTYSHGHSIRVAEYSEKIARMLGKDEDECYRIYYAALLHDVGKIGIPNAIINKNGRLTNDEYETIKQHPVMGNQILSSISEYPYLSIGAHFHHERYDGRGYPEKLKGEDIPEIARIISVADAYDAMSSNRSYRAAIPQQIIREEIVKGAGTQFDPQFAKIMQKLIDQDFLYQMQEKKTVGELAGKNELHCNTHRSEISDGIIVIPFITKLHLKVERKKEDKNSRGASFILFDSLDGRFHDDEMTIRDLSYFEYCELWLDGTYDNKNVRKVQVETKDLLPAQTGKADSSEGEIYDIEAVKIKDHAMITINNGTSMITVTIALPDSSRYVYMSLTGESCDINDVTISKEEKPVNRDYIPRIAEKISYIEGTEGDIPSVQVDGHRSDFSQGLFLGKELRISFHAMSLPTSRLIWHCPYLVVYSSKNGAVYGEGYKEYALIRLDGESLETTGESDNTLVVNKNDDFKSWDEWKAFCRKGFDSTVAFERQGNMITTTTENFGIDMMNTTEIKDGEANIYVALTGDQVALTKIMVKKD